MFQRTAQNKDELLQALAADYQAASARLAEIHSERARLLAAPLAPKEQARILKLVLDRSRARFEAEMDGRLSTLNEPGFDLNDPAYIDALDPIKILNAHPSQAWSDAVNAIFAPLILEFFEHRAKDTGGDKSTLTLAKKQTELARLDAQIIETESAASRALSQWRDLAGNMSGYP